MLENVKHVILSLSGKGGVGKTTVASTLAMSLALAGNRVGLLDVDLCGPSVARVLGLDGKEVLQSSEGWVPVQASENLSVMSIAFLLKNPDDPVVWRGPKKTAMIKQFLTDVVWGELDYLIIDTPPGTSDEHLSLAEFLQGVPSLSAVIVTTPQDVALADVRKEVGFCEKLKINIVGIIENMSGYICPHCSDCQHVFSSGGGERLAAECQVPLLGKVPLDPNLAQSMDEGVPFVSAFKDSNAAKVFAEITTQITA